MFDNEAVLGLIPARKGSKRLPRKNVQDFCGKPLIMWSIEAAFLSRIVDDVIVSTDDRQVELICDPVESLKVIQRPESLATDLTSMDKVIINALNMLKSEGQHYGYILLLQPTSPLRNAVHIDEAFDQLGKHKASGIIGVCETEQPIEWCGHLDENQYMDTFMSNAKLGKQKQEYKPSYRINGAIYITKVERFLQEGTLFLKEDLLAYIMDKEVSTDIDEEIDVEIATYYFKKLSEN